MKRSYDRFYALLARLDAFFNNAEKARASIEAHGSRDPRTWDEAAHSILPDPEFEAAVDWFADKLSRRGVGEAHLLRQAGVYSGAERVR